MNGLVSRVKLQHILRCQPSVRGSPILSQRLFYCGSYYLPRLAARTHLLNALIAIVRILHAEGILEIYTDSSRLHHCGVLGRHPRRGNDLVLTVARSHKRVLTAARRYDLDLTVARRYLRLVKIVLNSLRSAIQLVLILLHVEVRVRVLDTDEAVLTSGGRHRCFNFAPEFHNIFRGAFRRSRVTLLLYDSRHILVINILASQDQLMILFSIRI